MFYSLIFLFFFFTKVKQGHAFYSRYLFSSLFLLCLMSLPFPGLIFLFLAKNNRQQRTLEGRRPSAERGLGLRWLSSNCPAAPRAPGDELPARSFRRPEGLSTGRPRISEERRRAVWTPGGNSQLSWMFMCKAS